MNAIYSLVQRWRTSSAFEEDVVDMLYQQDRILQLQARAINDIHYLHSITYLLLGLILTVISMAVLAGLLLFNPEIHRSAKESLTTAQSLYNALLQNMKHSYDTFSAAYFVFHARAAECFHTFKSTCKSGAAAYHVTLARAIDTEASFLRGVYKMATGKAENSIEDEPEWEMVPKMDQENAPKKAAGGGAGSMLDDEGGDEVLP